MIASNVAPGDEVTIVLVCRPHRARVVEVASTCPQFSVALTNDNYTGTYWFGIHEEGRAWFRGQGDDIEATVLLQQSAVG